jgi:hypothetical protein
MATNGRKYKKGKKCSIYSIIKSVAVQGFIFFTHEARKICGKNEKL